MKNRGGHLEFFKTLKGARVAPAGFLIRRSPSIRNSNKIYVTTKNTVHPLDVHTNRTLSFESSSCLWRARCPDLAVAVVVVAFRRLISIVESTNIGKKMAGCAHCLY